jgi:hypothetical protein
MLLKFAVAYAAAIAVWALANSKDIKEGATVALTYGIFALPFALAAAGLSWLLEPALGSIGVFVAVLAVSLAFHWAASRRANNAEPGSTIPYALIFAVVWSLASW